VSKDTAELKQRLYGFHARLCRAMASEKRLEILDELKEGERRVDDLASALGTSKANTSQHLSVLREAGIVCSRREKRFVYYRICDRRILEACALIRGVMLDQLRREETAHRAILELIGQGSPLR